MKRSDLTFTSDFVERTVFDGIKKGSWNYDKEKARVIDRTLRVSKDTNEFVVNFLDDVQNAKYTAYSALLSKYTNEYIAVDKIQKIAALDSLLKTFTLCDAGSVKIGSQNFYALIPNGYGDGDCFVVVVKRDSPISNIAFYNGKQTGFFRGSCDVYTYDCGNDVAFTLRGTVVAYTLPKCVVLVYDEEA